MNQTETVYYRQTSPGQEEYRIGQRPWIDAPSYIPEIKGGEDILVLLENRNVLDENNPVMVPGSRWPQLRDRPMFKDYETQLQDVVRNQPLIYWDPPELFRKSHPDTLVRLAFRGSRSKRRKFNKKLRARRFRDALDMLPDFHGEFVERRLASLVRQDNELVYEDVAAEIEDDFPKNGAKATDAWREKDVDSGGYQRYMTDMIQDAARFPSTFVVPTVPVLTKSTEKSIRRRALGANRAVKRWALEFDDAPFGHELRSYYHLYADVNVLETDTDVDEWAKRTVEEELRTKTYAGLVLTMSRLRKAWAAGMDHRLEDFVTNLANMAHEADIPLIMPRSNWCGLYLTDAGVTAFGSLLNGNEEYTSGGGAGKKKHFYGKVPVIEFAQELDVAELSDILENMGTIPSAEGLPERPPRFTPGGGSYEEQFGSPRDFRIEFGKALRFNHAAEARRVRDAREEGQQRPAKRYLERTDHEYLGS